MSVDNPATAAFKWPAANPPNPSKLQFLDVSMIREGPLGELLSVTSRLQQLKWFWSYHPDLKDRWVTDIIDLEKITADLSIVEETDRCGH